MVLKSVKQKKKSIVIRLPLKRGPRIINLKAKYKSLKKPVAVKEKEKLKT